MKEGIGYSKYHQYTAKSFVKNCFLVVLIAGLILNTEFGPKPNLKKANEPVKKYAPV